MGSAYMHGWISLPAEGDLYMEHGVPRQVRLNRDSWLMMKREQLVDEIADLSGLHVTLGEWEACEDFNDEMAATIQVNPRDITEVLNRLAHASAETFYDRYHKPIDESDTDFDTEACAQDFNIALQACHMKWDQLDKPAMRDCYRHALHQAIDEFAGRRSH